MRSERAGRKWDTEEIQVCLCFFLSVHVNGARVAHSKRTGRESDLTSF